MRLFTANALYNTQSMLQTEHLITCLQLSVSQVFCLGDIALRCPCLPCGQCWIPQSLACSGQLSACFELTDLPVACQPLGLPNLGASPAHERRAVDCIIGYLHTAFCHSRQR